MSTAEQLRAAALDLLAQPQARSSILKQAAVLGMNPEEDADYLVLAAESLLAALPDEWTEGYDQEHEHTYWYNDRTVSTGPGRSTSTPVVCASSEDAALWRERAASALQIGLSQLPLRASSRHDAG